MYYLGEPSQTIVTINVPGGIEAVNLSETELVYRFKSINGISDIVQNSAVNLTGSLPIDEGTYKVTIVARSNYVEVSYT